MPQQHQSVTIMTEAVDETLCGAYARQSKGFSFHQVVLKCKCNICVMKSSPDTTVNVIFKGAAQLQSSYNLALAQINTKCLLCFCNRWEDIPLVLSRLSMKNSHTSATEICLLGRSGLTLVSLDWLSLAQPVPSCLLRDAGDAGDAVMLFVLLCVCACASCTLLPRVTKVSAAASVFILCFSLSFPQAAQYCTEMSRETSMMAEIRAPPPHTHTPPQQHLDSCARKQRREKEK